MNYEVKEQLYEGKAKQVFATNDPEIVMVHYKDDATAGDALGIDYSAFNDLAGQVVEVTTAE